jgi:hypothetical protein
MKFLLISFLVFLSVPVFAKDPLVGKRFNQCDTDSKYYDWDYSVEYMSDKEEFEAEVFRDKSSKDCKGKAQFAIGRIWKYEINGNELVTTLQEVRVMLTHKDFIDIFNEKQICGISNWKLDEFVNCEGKNVLYTEELPGYRTILKFKLKRKELHLTEDKGDEFKLLQDN